MHPLRVTLPAASAFLIFACSNHSGASASQPPPAKSAAASAQVASAVPAIATPTIADAVVDAGAPAPPTPAAPPSPKVVLHLGDSMVGGFGGLTKALEGKFKALGAQFHSDTQVSVSIQTFDQQRKLQELIAKWHPDLVILTLGANDMTVPFPTSEAGFVRSIAQKAAGSGRDCYWLTPAPWRKDTGIIDVVKKNAAPCKVYDSGPLKISRGGDGIHPTDGGGMIWADGFWAFYQGGGTGTLTLDSGAP